MKIQEYKNFLKAQGYKINNILAQDNKYTIDLEENGSISCIKRIKHIKMRYFCT